jgi:hypothetical protein
MLESEPISTPEEVAKGMNILIHWIHSLDRGICGFLNGFAGNWLIDRIAGFEEDTREASRGRSA